MLSLLGNITIRTKVFIAFGSVLLVTLGLGLFAIQRIGMVNAAAVDVRDNWMPSAILLGKFAQIAEEARSLAGNVILTEPGDARVEAMARVTEVRAAAEKARKDYEPTIIPGEERKLADEMNRAWENYLVGSAKTLALLKENHDKEATAIYLGETHDLIVKVRAALQADVDFNDKSGVKAGDSGEQIYITARVMIIGALGFATLLCAFAGVVIIVSVSRPIKSMTVAMGKLAGGDKGVEIPARDNKDEIGDMAKAVDIFKQNMIRADEVAAEQKADRTVAFEAMRTAKETAEIADRAKSEFLATMSHELRTPLNAILGFSELMKVEVFGPLGDERYRDFSEDIYASGSHLLSIIDDVLDLSKATAGKLELDEGSMDAREVVQSVCRLVRPRIDGARLSLTVNVPSDDLLIYADERVVKQILFNLLSNACKFTLPGGRLECAVSVDRKEITFAVSDTGVGIPAEHLDRVLKPFIQVDSSLSRRHEGAGLGLSIVKAMAELHGGFLRLDSEVGVGTIASVVFPRSRLKLAGTDVELTNATSLQAFECLVT